MFKIRFETNGVMFSVSKAHSIAAILRHYAEAFELTSKVLDGNTTGDKGAIFDLNGDCIGTWEYRP